MTALEIIKNMMQFGANLTVMNENILTLLFLFS